jgi:alkanesulfonate monooxygenase SsuD/methylene tetrahydromethanopterin reductase-like flavin-dependent oxidoreductase (luciferase family)
VDGDYHKHEGKHYTVHDARIFTLPDEPPPVYIAASGAESIALPARAGDGLVATAPERTLTHGEGALRVVRTALAVPVWPWHLVSGQQASSARARRPRTSSLGGP